MVTSDRGFRESNCDDIVLRLDNGDKVNYMYCVTPQPIQRTNWGLYVSECKLVVLKMRRADLIIDDLLSMLC